MKTIRFIIDENNNYYKVEPARTLLHFTEFDFTLFWEQCISAGKTAHKTGSLPGDIMSSARNTVAKCHPYVDACISGSFDCVAVDCIIAYICSSEHIGLEELWARCISPKNSYEAALFKRISEYKTGRAINQWVNIVRLGDYARAKLNFVFDGDIIPSYSVIKARKEYFDLCFAVAANELGYPPSEMPSVKVYNHSLLPGSAFRMGGYSKMIYGGVKDILRSAPLSGIRGHNEVLCDQSAMDAFAYIKDMARPSDGDMKTASEAAAQPDELIYMPNSFKAIIDLEFDAIVEEGIMIKRCSSCGRFFVAEEGYDRPYCSRVTSSGKTCRQLDEEKLRDIAQAKAAADARRAKERERRRMEESRNAELAQNAEPAQNIEPAVMSDRQRQSEKGFDEFSYDIPENTSQKREERTTEPAARRRKGADNKNDGFTNFAAAFSSGKRRKKNESRPVNKSSWENDEEFDRSVIDYDIYNISALNGEFLSRSEPIHQDIEEVPPEKPPEERTEDIKEAPKEERAVTIPPETEKRSQKIYNAFYKRIGKIIDENEFREWSQYLSNLKRNIKNGDGTLAQLEEFLNSSEKMFEELKNNPEPLAKKAPAVPVKPAEPAPAEPEFSPETFEQVKPSPKRVMSREELIRAAKEMGLELPDALFEEGYNPRQEAMAETEQSVTEDGKVVKPFVPKKYSSLYEAMQDRGDTGAAPARVIRKPEWEKLPKK